MKICKLVQRLKSEQARGHTHTHTQTYSLNSAGYVLKSCLYKVW